MRSLFRHARLKTKLTVLIMMISLVVVCLGASSFILAEVLSYRQALTNRLSSTAGVVGANTYPSLLLHKQYEANRILQSLSSSPDIAAAYIFTSGHEPFANYINIELLSANGLAGLDKSLLEQSFERQGIAYSFGHKLAQLCAPITESGQVVGGICLQSDLTPLYQLIGQFILGTILVCMILAAVAYLLSTKLQETITRPISRLASTIQRVAQRQDFEARAEKSSDDEIGELVDGFNFMLSQLASRETQLEEHRHNLEQQVSDRTQQLKATNDELSRSIDALDKMRLAAEQANQAKSMFLAKMSHEIRTPMIGIMGMAEQLANARLPEPQHQMAVDVQSSGEMLLGILDDVLDFSRIEAGRMELENIPFSLLDVCEEIAALFAGEARRKGLELVCFVAPTCLGPFRGDPIRIRQILSNLVGNAIKFTSHGWICLAAETLPDNKVRLSITDTGIGIPETAQKTIFDSFSQADNSMARKYGGSGLGLSIVAQLTSLMQGECRLSSHPGQGSRFEIDLPLPAADASACKTWKYPPLKIGTAVIADLNPHAEKALATILSHAGIKTRTSTADKLLADFQAQTDLLIVDERLLEAAGGLVAALGAADAASHCVLTTNGEGRRETIELAARGTARLLQKPLRLAELFNVIGERTRPDYNNKAPHTKPVQQGRVLLVEDNPTTQRLVQLILGQAGYHIDQCDNGEMALASIAQAPYDLVLMDCEMPGVNGFDATLAMRGGGHTLPIVALTAHVGGDIHDRCRQSGMDDVLHKPFRQHELLTIVGKWIPQLRETHHAH